MRIGESIRTTDYGRGWVTCVVDETVGIRLACGTDILLPRTWLARRELAALLEPLPCPEHRVIDAGNAFVNSDIATTTRTRSNAAESG